NGDQDYHPVTIVTPSSATASATKALRASGAVPGCEFCATEQILVFDVTQHLVSLAVGLDSGASQPDGLRISMHAYDDAAAQGTQVGQAQTSCLGTSGPTAVTTPLQVDDPLRRIRSVSLVLQNCISGDPSLNSSFLVDNLRYDRPLHPPARENIPPLI